ncbi:MAG TPA: GntR family transcriptional regulator [Ruminococcus sp.]|nr:GntR family transcriptional regulator [Ruminococcus sp.]
MEDYKYLTIVEWAKNYIATEKLKPNDRFLTEKELCAIHGVSRQTVRQALMRLESENIICRVRGSGTFVKGGVTAVPALTRSIGVISTYFSDYIFPYIVTGIESVLNEAGYAMQLAITHNQVYEETQALRSMMSHGVQGLIVEPSKSALPNPNMDLYMELKRSNVPLVFFNAKYPWSDFPCVAMDDVAAGKMVTDHLFNNGHTRISAIFALDNIQGHKRYKGFMESCIAHGANSAEKNVIWFAAAEMKKLFQYGRERLMEMLRNSTAVVCYNDDAAISLLQFCKEYGISVPDEVSIVGIDDSSLAPICDVPLTTAAHPHRRLGEMAARSLLDQIAAPQADHKDVLFNPDLKERNSVKDLNAAEMRGNIIAAGK